MSKLLIDDYPIQVLPKLAKEIGLNEAIILQQMHYWTNNSKHIYDGKKWIYNSYNEWQKQFPFWSVVTIKRAIYKLEEKNLVYVGNYNKAGFDKTKWYSVNYEEVEGMIRPSYQNDTTSVSKRYDGEYQNDTTNTIDYPENTSEINKPLSRNSTMHPYKDIIDYLNERAGKQYRHTTDKTKKLISARCNEGFELEDFKQVIDNKVKEWQGSDMEKFLRPETLFGTKFEGYLNQGNTPQSKPTDTAQSFDSFIDEL